MFPQGVRGQGRSKLAVAPIFPLTCTPSLWAAHTIRRGHWMSSHEALENGLARGAHRPRGTQGGRGNSAARLGAGGEVVLVAGVSKMASQPSQRPDRELCKIASHS